MSRLKKALARAVAGQLTWRDRGAVAIRYLVDGRRVASVDALRRAARNIIRG